MRAPSVAAFIEELKREPGACLSRGTDFPERIYLYPKTWTRYVVAASWFAFKAHTPEHESFERNVARINEYLRGEQDGAVANIEPDSFLVAADLVSRQTNARTTYIKNMSLLEEFGGQGIVEYVYVAPI